MSDSPNPPPSRPILNTRFPHDLVPELLYYMSDVQGPDYKIVPTDYARDAIIRRRYYLCSLVSSYWNKIFTPGLYREIVIYQHRLPLLLHTLWHVRPEHRHLIYRMRVIFVVGESGSGSGRSGLQAGGVASVVTPVLPPIPNLVRLSIENLDFRHSLPLVLGLLPSACRIDICGQTIDSGSLPKLIRFIQRAKPHYFSCDVVSNVGLHVYGGHDEGVSPLASSLQRVGQSFLTRAVLRVGKCATYLQFDGFNAEVSNDSLRNMGRYLGEVEIELKPKGPSLDLQHNTELKTACFVNTWYDQTKKQWQTVMSTMTVTSLHVIFEELPMASMEEPILGLKTSGRIPDLRVSVLGKSLESCTATFPTLSQHGILVESTAKIGLSVTSARTRRQTSGLKPNLNHDLTVGRFTERWESSGRSDDVNLRPMSFSRRPMHNLEDTFMDQMGGLEVETARKVWTKRSGFRATSLADDV